MQETMTKARLLDEMRGARAEWAELLAEIPDDRKTEPGATGDWSVRDVLAHLTHYARWFLNASDAAMRGEPPPRDGSEGMELEARNQFYHAKTRDLPLAETRAQFEDVYARVEAMIEGLPEAFLIEPQHVPGAPGPMLIWKPIKSEIIDHSRDHAAMIREWMAESS